MPNLSDLCEERACYRQQSSKRTRKTQLRVGLDVRLYLFPIQCSPSFYTVKEQLSLLESWPQQLASLSPNEQKLMSLLPPGPANTLPRPRWSLVPAALGDGAPQPRSQPCSTWYIIHCSRVPMRDPALCIHSDGIATLSYRYLPHNVYQDLQTTSFLKPLLKFAQ